MPAPTSQKRGTLPMRRPTLCLHALLEVGGLVRLALFGFDGCSILACTSSCAARAYSFGIFRGSNLPECSSMRFTGSLMA
jgi:hypothetical protein